MFTNQIKIDSFVLAAASKSAALDACAEFSRAKFELAQPKEIRRSAREIHARASDAFALANRLARIGGGR